MSKNVLSSLSVEDLEVLKKLKHLHVVEYGIKKH